MKRSVAQDYLRILEEFRKNPLYETVEGLTREDVADIVYVYFKNASSLYDPNIEAGVADLNKRLEAAKHILENYVNSPLSDEEVFKTVPDLEDLKNLEEQQEKLKQEAETGKAEAIQEQRANVRNWIKRLKDKAIAEALEKAKEGGKEVISKVAEKVEEQSLGLQLAIRPQAINIQSFFAKIASSPLKFLIDLGTSELRRTSPNAASAVWLISRGVTGVELTRAIAQARERGVYIDGTLIKKLVDAVEKQEGFKTGGIQFYKLLQIASKSELNITQAQLAGLVEVFTPQEPGTRAYNLSSPTSEQPYTFPSQTYTEGFAGSLAKGVLGKVSGKILDKFVDKAITAVGTKVIGEAATQALVTAVAPVVGNVTLFLIKQIGARLLKFGKDLLSKFLIAISGKGRSEEDKGWAWAGIAAAIAGGLGLIGTGSGLLVALGTGLVAVGGAAGLGALAMSAKGIALSGAGFMQALLQGLSEVFLKAIATPIIVALFSIPVVIAIIFFIINAGAYVVPPGGPLPGVPMPSGPILTGCPAQMWPVSLNKTYFISQGPGGTFSHIAPYQEAIDINAHYDSWYRDSNKEAYRVLATHPGTVIISDSNGVNGGNRVRIKDTCGGDFMTGYEHMLVNYVKVGDNVLPGTSIGVLGNTGVCTDCPHVHYVFRNGDGTHKPEDQSIPPILKIPYIPKDVPKYCSFNTNRCDVNVP